MLAICYYYCYYSYHLIVVARHKNTHLYEETIHSEVVPSIRKTFGKDKGKESGIKLAKKKLGMAIRSVLGEGKGRNV